jgi:hypothetical protein
MLSELKNNLRVYLRLKSSNNTFWFLNLVFSRYVRNFKVGKRSCEFLSKQKNFLFRFFCLEIFKFKTNNNRDILGVFLVKKNPININLWLQLFIDKSSLEKKISVLRSAIFFFPKNRFLMHFIVLVFGFEINMERKIYFFLNRFLVFLNIISFRLKNRAKNFKFLKIFCKISKVNFFFHKKIYFLGKKEKFSKINFEETFISANFFSIKKLNNKNHSDISLIFNVGNLLTLQFFRFFKINKKTDHIILQFSKEKIFYRIIKKLNSLLTTKKINNVSFFEKIYNIFYFQIYFLIKKKKSPPPTAIMKNYFKKNQLVENCCELLTKKVFSYFCLTGSLCSISSTSFKTFDIVLFYPFKSKTGSYEKYFHILGNKQNMKFDNCSISFQRIFSNFELVFF